MVLYAVRSVPWVRSLLAAGVVAGLVEVVAWRPGQTWALIGCAIGVLAGAAAWTMDEPAAGVVDTAPRTLLWRTAVRSPLAVLPLVVWSGCLMRQRPDLAGHASALGFTGAAAALAGIAWTTWRRTAGEAMPGERFAIVVMPVATAWSLGQPFGGDVPVFPSAWAAQSDWTRHTVGWGSVAVLAGLLLAAALADVRWWGSRVRS